MERKPLKKSPTRKPARRSKSPVRTFGANDLVDVASEIERLAGNLRAALEVLARYYPDLVLDCPPPEGLRARKRSRVAMVRPSGICQGC